MLWGPDVGRVTGLLTVPFGRHRAVVPLQVRQGDKRDSLTLIQDAVPMPLTR